MIRNSDLNIARAMEGAGILKADLEAVRAVCDRIVLERSEFIRERGEASLGPLMGVAMRELRGKADGKVISEVLTESIKRHLT